MTNTPIRQGGMGEDEKKKYLVGTQNSFQNRRRRREKKAPVGQKEGKKL